MQNQHILDCYDMKATQSVNVQRAIEFISKSHEIDLDKEPQLRIKLKSLESKYRSKLKIVNRHKERLNQEWLKSPFDLQDYIITPGPSTSTKSKPGRTHQPFEKISKRSQRRRRFDMLNPKVDSIGKALFAAQTVANQSKEYNLVKVIGHIIKNRENAFKMLGLFKDHPGFMSHEQAFSFFIDNGFSRSQYQDIHEKNPGRVPSYWVIAKMKKICSPPQDTIAVSSTKIKVQLQALMKHSSERIIELQKSSIIDYLEKKTNLIM